MRTFGFAVLGGLAGLIGGFALGVGLGLLAVELFGVSNFEGGAGMLVFLVIAPLVSLVSALIGAIWAGVATSRRAGLRAAGQLPPRDPWPRHIRIAVGVGLGLMVGYAVGIVLIRDVFDLIRGSHYYATYAGALAASWFPALLALCAAGLGYWIGGRERPPTPIG